MALMAANDSWRAPLVEEVRARIRWLISLRWIAAAVLLAVVTGARWLLGIPLPVAPLYLGNLALLLSNVLYRLLVPRVRITGLLINVQITLDLLLLAYLLHFAGGIENPFVLFFVFHMVIASILLSARAAYAQATAAVLFFALLAAGELWGPLRHYHLGSSSREQLAWGNRHWLLGYFTAFAGTLYITVYMTTSIVRTLRRRERELENAVGSLEAANEKLAQKDREKSRYVQVVSHDIKGSLSAVQSCLKVVLEGLLGAVSEPALAMIDRAERRCLSLLRFVEELYYLSTIRVQDAMRKGKVDLSRLTTEVLAALRPALEAKALSWECDDASGHAEVTADPEAVRQILIQLLDNAVKYTSQGGAIRLRLERSADGGQVRVSVTDSGIGISAADLPRVFEDFYAADVPANRDAPSTGLGLAIARQIVVMHGGSIEAKSEPGQGSTFRFALPIVEK